jgi:hypothetical protein
LAAFGSASVAIEANGARSIFTNGHLHPRLCGWGGSFARAAVACNANRDQTSITMQRASRARQVNRAQAQKMIAAAVFWFTPASSID